MSGKRRPKKIGSLIIRTAAASALGLMLTLLIAALSAWCALKNAAGERGLAVWLMTAVFIGSMFTSVMNHSSIAGAVPRVLISTFGFCALLMLISLFLSNGGIQPLLNCKIMSAALLGSITGLVTNLVKSNKSYINKSKRKRSIT